MSRPGIDCSPSAGRRGTVGVNIRVGAASASTWSDPLAEALLVHSKTWRKTTSPGHCANIMAADSAEMGAAYATETRNAMGIYWPQAFGRQRKP